MWLEQVVHGHTGWRWIARAPPAPLCGAARGPSPGGASGGPWPGASAARGPVPACGPGCPPGATQLWGTVPPRAPSGRCGVHRCCTWRHSGSP
jgi:hypothetical protein